MREMANSDLPVSSMLFGVSSAFFCKTKYTSGPGNTVGLWNGDDTDGTSWGNGEVRMTPNPPFPADATLGNVVPIITPMFGHVSGDYPVVDILGVVTTPSVGFYSSVITITWKDKADVVISARQIWCTVMWISPRRAVDSATYPLSTKLAKQALYGGVPSVEANVFPQ